MFQRDQVPARYSRGDPARNVWLKLRMPSSHLRDDWLYRVLPTLRPDRVLRVAVPGSVSADVRSPALAPAVWLSCSLSGFGLTLSPWCRQQGPAALNWSDPGGRHG